MEHFGRIPFARQDFDEDYIPSIVYPDEVSFDRNSPDSEVSFSDENSRHHSIHLDWHNTKWDRKES